MTRRRTPSSSPPRRRRRPSDSASSASSRSWSSGTTRPTRRVLDAARAEIMRSTMAIRRRFSTPSAAAARFRLKAQRLGLEAHASDLNPVAVLITKALIEIPPKFAGLPPVNPESAGQARQHGLARRSGPRRGCAPLRTLDARGGRAAHRPPLSEGEAARRARRRRGDRHRLAMGAHGECPNPACGAEMPLVRSFALSTKKGRQAWVEPIVDALPRRCLRGRTGMGVPPEGRSSGRARRCLVCGRQRCRLTAHVRKAVADGMGAQLMAVVAEGRGARIYVPTHGPRARGNRESAQARLRTARHGPAGDGFELPRAALRHDGRHSRPLHHRQLVALTTSVISSPRRASACGKMPNAALRSEDRPPLHY